MIKTGRQVNVMLGHGDSERPNLLSGTFGDAGDVVVLLNGFGKLSRNKKKRNKLSSDYRYRYFEFRGHDGPRYNRRPMGNR